MDDSDSNNRVITMMLFHTTSNQIREYVTRPNEEPYFGVDPLYI